MYSIVSWWRMQNVGWRRYSPGGPITISLVVVVRVHASHVLGLTSVAVRGLDMGITLAVIATHTGGDWLS